MILIQLVNHEPNFKMSTDDYQKSLEDDNQSTPVHFLA